MKYLPIFTLSFMLISLHAHAGILNSFTRSLPRFATTARTHFFNNKILTPTTLLGGVVNKQESQKTPIVEEMEQVARLRGFGCWISPDAQCMKKEKDIKALNVAQFKEALKKDRANRFIDVQGFAFHAHIYPTRTLFVPRSIAPHTYAQVAQVAKKLGHKPPAAIFFVYEMDKSSSRGPHSIALNYDQCIKLTPVEQTSVIAHEEAHHALGHIEKRNRLKQDPTLTKRDRLDYHRKHELEADIKSAELLESAYPLIHSLAKIDHLCVGLHATDAELIKIEIEEEHTHPCIERRIRHLFKWQAAQDAQKQKSAENKS